MFGMSDRKILCLIFIIVLLCISVLPAAGQAEDTSTPAPLPPPVPRVVVKAAPLPVQIQSAKKVFISNAGGRVEDWPGNSWLGGGPNRFYDQFYAAMKDWGRYELVAAPTDADLIFEIRAVNYLGREEGIPRFELTIYDPKTRVVLWTLAEYLDLPARISNFNKNFDKGINKFMDHIKQLVEPAATAVTSSPKQPLAESSVQ